MIMPFLFLSSYFQSYSSSLISDLVLADAGMPLNSKPLLWLEMKINLFLVTRAKCVCYSEKLFWNTKDWKSALWHIKQILLFLSPDNFLVAPAFLCVKSLSWVSKRHSCGTTTTNFVFLIEWVHWFDSKIDTSWQQVFNSLSFSEHAL